MLKIGFFDFYKILFNILNKSFKQNMIMVVHQTINMNNNIPILQRLNQREAALILFVPYPNLTNLGGLFPASLRRPCRPRCASANPVEERESRRRSNGTPGQFPEEARFAVYGLRDVWLAGRYGLRDVP